MDCLLAWLVGWLVGWSVGRSVGWLVGWSVGWLVVCASKVKSYHSKEHYSAKFICCWHSVDVQTVCDDQLPESVKLCEPTFRPNLSNLQKETSVHVIIVPRVRL